MCYYITIGGVNMRHALTFKIFKETEREQAEKFCERVYEDYNAYAKRTFKKPHIQNYTCNNGENDRCLLVWYRW